MALKVGDFVRWNSTVTEKNAHLALSTERGLIVSVDIKAKTVDVIWPDGERHTHSMNVLARSEGTVGHIAHSMGERRKPICENLPPPIKRRPLKKPTLTIKRATPPLADPSPKSRACWAMAEEKEIKGFVTEPKTPNENPGFMRFAVPMTVCEVRNIDWPRTTPNIKLSRSANSVTITWPNGEKQSLTPTAARVLIYGRFSQDMADTLSGRLQV